MTRSVNATRRVGSLSNQTPAPKNHIIQDETDHAIVFSLENIEWEFDRQQKGSLNLFLHLAVVMQPPLDEPLPGVALCLLEGRLAQLPRGVRLQSEQLE